MMVNRFDDSRLLLVLQVDHSRIAGLLAAHWGNEEFARPKPYASMVVAAQEHDSGWWDWEIKPTVNEQGYPIDYLGSIRNLGQGVWLDFYRHGIARVLEQDPYAGWAVSMHGDGLLTQGMGLLPGMPNYSVDENVKVFLNEQKQMRTALLEDLKQREEYRDATSEEHLWTNFKLMEVFDQFAQYLCNRYPLNSTDRKVPTNTLSDIPIPVAPGRPDVKLEIDVQDESTAVVRPWPFDVERLEVAFQGRLVPNRPFAGQDDFLPEFYKGERFDVCYTLVKA